jgi:hypothetical protein
MRTMMTNQMFGAMGIFGGINNNNNGGGIPFEQSLQQISFQLPNNNITTKPCKTSIYQNNNGNIINKNNKNEKSPIKAKKAKISSIPTSQVFFLI